MISGEFRRDLSSPLNDSGSFGPIHWVCLSSIQYPTNVRPGSFDYVKIKLHLCRWSEADARSTPTHLLISFLFPLIRELVHLSKYHQIDVLTPTV